MKSISTSFFRSLVICIGMGWLGAASAGAGTNNALDDLLDDIHRENSPSAPTPQPQRAGNKATHDETRALTREQARAWAEKIWVNYPNNNLSYMYSLYESTVRIPAFGKHISLTELIKSQQVYTSRWAYRSCTPLDFAWNGNHIEVRFSYTCTNNKGKTVSGYCKNSIYISANNKIESFEDKSSGSHVPPFSGGMKR